MNPTPFVFDELSEELTVRDYARSEGITIQTAYRRIWDGRVPARQVYGRWLIAKERHVDQVPELTGTKSQTPDNAPRLPAIPKPQMNGNQEHEIENRAEKAGGQ